MTENAAEHAVEPVRLAYVYDDPHVAEMHVRVMATSWIRLIPLLSLTYGGWCLLMLIITWHPRFGISASALWKTASIILAFLIAYHLHPRVIARRTMSRLTPGERGESTWVFDVDGARFARGGTAGAFRWELVSLLVRFPDGILAYSADRSFWWPVKSFASVDELERVERWAISSVNVYLLWENNHFWDWLAGIVLAPLSVVVVATLLSATGSEVYLASNVVLLENVLDHIAIDSYTISVLFLAPSLYFCVKTGRSNIWFAIALGTVAAIGSLLSTAYTSNSFGGVPAGLSIGLLLCSVCMWWIVTQRYFGGPLPGTKQTENSYITESGQ